MRPSVVIATLLLMMPILVVEGAKKKYKDCEYQELTACNRVFMSSFTNNTQNLKVAYCNGFQVYANCLTDSTCFGKFLDLNRFMILQHMIMDNKLKYCKPPHDIRSLKLKVKANKKYRKKIKNITRVDEDNFEDCAAQVHRNCSSKMAQDLSADSRMCFGVENFLECYESPGVVCKAKIYKDFLKIVRMVARTLINMFKSKQGVMPNCYDPVSR